MSDEPELTTPTLLPMGPDAEVALRALFACDVECAADEPSLDEADAFPEERAQVARAVAKRRAEFLTARRLARRAMARFGVPPSPLLPNADRSPRWPPGCIGTISHTDGYCAVAVARCRDARAIGLDVEREPVLRVALEPLVCTPSERRWLEQQPQAERGVLGMLLFSAKEAFYKCQYPVTGTFLDFQQVEMTLSGSGGFEVVAVADEHVERMGARAIVGRWLRRGGLSITAATWRIASET